MCCVIKEVIILREVRVNVNWKCRELFRVLYNFWWGKLNWFWFFLLIKLVLELSIFLILWLILKLVWYIWLVIMKIIAIVKWWWVILVNYRDLVWGWKLFKKVKIVVFVSLEVLNIWLMVLGFWV